MTLRDQLNTALDAAVSSGERGAVSVSTEAGHSAEVDVVDVDRLGVRVRNLRITRAVDVPVHDVAKRLPESLRSLPERVIPIEVDSKLNGGTFRTPVHRHDNDYYQVDVRGRTSEVKRFKVGENGRQQADFTLTRDGLGRLVDDLSVS